MVNYLKPLMLLLLIVAISSVAHAADISTFRVGQAVAKYPEIKAYIDACDQADNPIVAIQPIQLTATIGQTQVYVKAATQFKKSGEGVAYVFLVDISRSLAQGQFDQMKTAINHWIDKMRDSDRAAIMSFGEKVTIIQDYTIDRNALKNAVKTLAISDNKTQLHQGIAKAMELSRRTDTSLPTRRLILTLSDGEDDFPGGITRDEVLASMKEDRIPLYAIGVSQKGKEGDASRKKLGEFARMSGGELFDGNDTDWAKLYEVIQQKILNSFLVKIDAAKALADGKSYRLQITLNSYGKSMADGLDMRILAPVTVAPTKETPKQWYKKIPVWAYGAAGGGLLFIFVFVVVRMRKKKAERLAAEEAQRKRHQTEIEEGKRRANEEAAARAEAEKKLLDEQYTVRKAEPPGLKIKLSVLGSTGDQRDYGIELSNRSYIGRSSECDLSITNDEEISKKHCELALEGGYVLISDLNSTNGTFVNGIPVKTGHRLKNGDLILLGRTEMRILF